MQVAFQALTIELDSTERLRPRASAADGRLQLVGTAAVSVLDACWGKQNMNNERWWYAPVRLAPHVGPTLFLLTLGNRRILTDLNKNGGRPRRMWSIRNAPVPLSRFAWALSRKWHPQSRHAPSAKKVLTAAPASKCRRLGIRIQAAGAPTRGYQTHTCVRWKSKSALRQRTDIFPYILYFSSESFLSTRFTV